MLGPIEREVMAQLFASIPEEMGAVLVRSARSPNIRERRDASAALFTADGELVSQASHIPVHLGAMPDAVHAVIAHGARPGDIWVLNDPYTGGTHLPDITVVEAIAPSAVFGPTVRGPAQGRRSSAVPPLGYSAVRAHHADVGGVRPGSMPPGARTLEEEGVVIPPTRIGLAGVPDDDAIADLVARMREPAIRRADLAAQMAATARGADRWRELVQAHGRAWLDDAVADLLDYAERRTRAALTALRAGSYEAEDALEGDGLTDVSLPIRLRLVIGEGTLTADFTGTAPAAEGNVNCPIAVTRSAVLFAARCIMPDDLPTNGGVVRCLDVIAPEGCLVNAGRPHAVAAGNVETSQRIADVMFLALASAGAPVTAQGQGTMNNVILGTEAWTYYETIGGGQGASLGGPGPSAVHVGMSNTLNTPVEVLELTLPLRVERYALRTGSGGGAGPGGHRGGDGVIRELRVLEDCALSLITERRRLAPAGRGGGKPGAPGRNSVDGVDVGAKCARDLKAGALLHIETPGGGGSGVSG